ncbi:SH3 domain-containing protein [Clostridium botulinum]|uniref:SH3b domain-containing protein n=1 Tax=Clostridium botulinum CFSAN001627 TaxID=1232189 RepID=M1ZV32_CLOBO|nr:SH3 domain-containing protein [Clostridium botulinum]EKN40500.1 hypothetical protein CFSAN001627_19183 [Clostridium botulinum CFSAN001627]MBN3417923.1 SH3 domain-containing protein [Clostridium botulinum]MBN3442610.1 SH3 domain-containing protein [Clostridium botulinum]MBY6806645.1 SH3 domain-containing protein [Clostridium botulinum]
MKKALIVTMLAAVTMVGSITQAFAAEKSKAPTVEKKQILTRAARTAGHVKITGDGVRLRAKPGLNGTVLALLDKGTLVEYNNEGAYVDGQEWLYVKYGSLEGYVSKNYVSFKY